jgi:hypothetical protein
MQRNRSFVSSQVSAWSGSSPIQRANVEIPFSPTDISNLHSWYDAADATTITQIGGQVSQWSDKSGNNRHATQGTGVKQPTWGTTTVNGKTVMNFSGSQFLIANASVTSNNLTHFVVFRKTSTNANTTYSRVLSLWTTSGGADYDNTNAIETHLSEASFNSVTPPLIGGYRNSSAICSIPIVANTPYLSWMTLNGANQNLWVGSTSGSAQASGTTSATALNSNRLTVGAGSAEGGGDAFMLGWFAEHITYTRVLTTPEIDSVKSYLINKWGVGG